jgi:hypothetical protein
MVRKLKEDVIKRLRRRDSYGVNKIIFKWSREIVLLSEKYKK